MAKTSAGILLHRRTAAGLEIFLVHPGGPLWAKKDRGAWSLPKGECGADEDALAAARRELEEETGLRIAGPFHELQPVRQRGGKTVRAWAVAGDCDAAAIRSNTFTMEWPPRSGRMAAFPEVDRAAWFPIAEARARILSGQVGLLDQLEAWLGAGDPEPGSGV